MATTIPKLKETGEPQTVTITLPPDAIRFMIEEGRRSGISEADVLRRAIATEKFIREQLHSGAEILLRARGATAPTKLVFKD